MAPADTGIASKAEQDEAYVAALQRERAGYAAKGRKDRVKAVDEELKRMAEGKEQATAPEPDDKEQATQP